MIYFDIITTQSTRSLLDSMGIEIERKFKVTNKQWKKGATGVFYRQGYLNHDKNSTVRIRVAGSKSFLTIKGASTGASRLEFEYDVPKADAETMLDNLCKQPIIEKTRYKIEYAGKLWEVDEFTGDNEGLIIAEIELSSEDEHFESPPWVGDEVTGETRYYNANLLENPFKNW